MSSIQLHQHPSAIDCSHEHVAGLLPATPQRIEDLIVLMRSDLLHIITRYHQMAGYRHQATDQGWCQHCWHHCCTAGLLGPKEQRHSPRFATHQLLYCKQHQSALFSSIQQLCNLASASTSATVLCIVTFIGIALCKIAHRCVSIPNAHSIRILSSE